MVALTCQLQLRNYEWRMVDGSLVMCETAVPEVCRVFCIVVGIYVCKGLTDCPNSSL